jgi:cysteine desulfurase
MDTEQLLSNNHQIQSLQDCCLQFGILLGLDTAISEEVLISVLIDPGYIYNLTVCKNTPEFLEYLINNPPYKLNETEKKKNQEKLLLDAIAMINKWTHMQKLEAYRVRYNNYLNSHSSQSCKACVKIEVDDFREVYLDHNATTYIRPEINKILNDYYDNDSLGFANPSSNTVQGKYASDLISDARKKIASYLYAQNEEIIFVGCGSAANNLAIKGIAFQYLEKKGHIITSKVEHPSVLKVMEYLETLGFSVTYLDVTPDGMVTSDKVKTTIRDNTILVSIMAVNNEIGTINPISEIGHICKEYNIPFMVDAIQAFGKIPIRPKEMGISLLAFSGHKIYAPKGIGGLYIEKGVNIVPQIHGGEQEFGLHSGTENVGSIIALGLAAELAHAEMALETERLLDIQHFFIDELRKIEPDFIVNGSLKNRIPNNLSIGFHKIDSGALLRSLNAIGISVSTGSACSSGKIGTSHVLKAIGTDVENYGTMRFSFGLNTTKEDLLYLFHYLPKILKKLREHNQ